MKWIIAILMACAIAEVASANGLAGQRLEQVVGDLIIDIGTDQTSTPVAGKRIEFDFALLDSRTGDPVPTTGVGLDIENNGQTMFNTDVITDPQTTYLFYTFPEPGSYTLKVVFFDTDNSPQELARASFPITISGSPWPRRAPYVAALFASLLVGWWAGRWGTRRRAAR